LKQEVVLNEKLELLQNIFDDLKNQSKSKIDFCKTEDKAICTYCTYKTICNRE
jgi:CRISPR/Cas system-associated exonuclease Cas4 (RecB family)